MRTFLILVFLAAPLHACLWDTDTLAQESEGMGDIKAVIVGGFPRNPPLYYEMRLTRVTASARQRTSPPGVPIPAASRTRCRRTIARSASGR